MGPFEVDTHATSLGSERLSVSHPMLKNYSIFPAVLVNLSKPGSHPSYDEEFTAAPNILWLSLLTSQFLDHEPGNTRICLYAHGGVRGASAASLAVFDFAFVKRE